jgi:hypothetical protein
MHPRSRHGKSGEAEDGFSAISGKNDGSSALDWIMHYAVPLIGIIGAALYGVLRLAYLFFYLRLRATPDEVGYGYSQVLADELIGAIELVVLTALFLMPLGIVAYFSFRMFQRMKNKKYSRQREDGFNWTTRVQKLVLWCLSLAIPIVLIGLPVIAWLEGQEARNGFTVRNVYVSHFIALPVLAVQAVPATFTWISGNETSKNGVSARQCLLYLGEANGISVFYDVYSQESIRIPSADIVITLQDTRSVPIGC